MDKANFLLGFEAALIVAVVLPGFVSVFYGLSDGSISIRFAVIFSASIIAAISGFFLALHGIAIGTLLAMVGGIATLQCVGKILVPAVEKTGRDLRKNRGETNDSVRDPRV